MKLGIIGGTGLLDLDLPGWDFIEWQQRSLPQTRYGEPSAPIRQGSAGSLEIAFLPRHGESASIAPHLINYRANIAALHGCGVTDIVAVNAVGGLSESMSTETIAVPVQLIDYTYGREQTYYDGLQNQLRHTDFTSPYSAELRRALLQAAAGSGVSCIDGGVYACTQGPRLETAAEVRRLIADGCDLVGMTAMPEAVLARELELNYASLCLVVNPGAGLFSGSISMEDIGRVVNRGTERISRLLQTLMAQFSG